MATCLVGVASSQGGLTCGMPTAGFGLSSVSWLVFAITFVFDLSRYSLERTWLWRFPLVLIAAGQVAQLRCTLHLLPWCLLSHCDHISYSGNCAIMPDRVYILCLFNFDLAPCQTVQRPICWQCLAA